MASLFALSFPDVVFSQPPPPPPPTSGHGIGKDQPAGGGAPIGEGIWMLITLAFSYGVYHFIKSREKIPDKLSMDELTSSADVLIQEKAVNSEKINSSNETGKVKTGRIPYQRNSLLPFADRPRIIAWRHSKSRVNV